MKHTNVKLDPTCIPTDMVDCMSNHDPASSPFPPDIDDYIDDQNAAPALAWVQKIPEASSRHSPFTNIPLEILDRVMEFVDSGKSLKAISLTCRDFLQPSQRMLFSRIKFAHKRNVAKRIHGLQNILASSPYISHYIRELRLVDRSKRPQIFSDYKIIEMLHRMLNFELNNVRKLEFKFSSNSNHSPRVKWENLTPEVQTTLHKMLLSPSIIDLSLHRIQGIPKTFFSCIQRIPVVKLDCVSFDFSDDISKDLTIQSSVVDECTLNPSHGLKSLAVVRLWKQERYLDTMLAQLEDCKIDTLILSERTYFNTSDDIVTINALIKHCKYVTTFDCRANKIYHGMNVSTLRIRLLLIFILEGNLADLDISPLQNLHTFKLIISCSYGYKCPYPLHDAENILARATNGTGIKEIIIEIRIYCLSDLKGFPMDEWESFDSLLSGLKFAQLQGVCFVLNNTSPDHTKRCAICFESEKEIISGLFPNMNRKGLIRVTHNKWY
ncbi:hypothetical protein BDQ17DRAFT_1543365 [Cyathus striatus]|nr:hypothetical protein BDQ17DRAFT_1543365 [Cyathus striatus]